MARVLVVDDDETVANVVVGYLQRAGHEATRVGDGRAALDSVAANPPDLIVLDLMLPGIDGFEVCRQIRARQDVPIIMVTARGEAEDRVRGLEGGADDYVAKPFQSRELLARIRAQARRARGEAGPKPERIEVGALVIDLGTRAVTMRGGAVALTTNEFAVVAALAQRAGRVLTREQLLQVVHGTLDDAFDRSIDVLISRIRGKLEEDPKNPRLVKTIRGEGYLLASAEP